MDGIVILLLLGAIIVLIVKINSLKGEVRKISKGVEELLATKNNRVSDSKYKCEASPEDIISGEQAYHTKYQSRPASVEEPVPQVVPKPAYFEEESNIAQEEYMKPALDIVGEEVAPVYDNTYEKTELISEEAAPFNGDTDNRNFFEKVLGTNWLSKIGIITLVLGIGFFVKYAIDQDWINEIGRVGIGILTGGLIVAIAHKLKAKYEVFSSILVGGGISVFYITITIAFREYAIFSQTLAFILLIIITLFSVLLSLLYNRKELAIFSLLGGFASPLMISTGAGNFVVLFSYILILNTGMLVLSFIKQWRIIGIIGYVLTLIFFWAWYLNSYEDQYLITALFVTLFFVQFYLLAIFDHLKTGNKISTYQVMLILSNNMSAYLAYLCVLGSYSSEIKGLVTISLAVVNAVVMMVLFRNKSVDRNLIYLVIAIVTSLVTLAVPVQLKSYVITIFWAAESVILLWLWQKSRIKVFRLGFILISALTLGSYIIDSYSAIMSGRLFVTGIVVIAAFVINALLLKRDTENRDPMDRVLLVKVFKIIIMILAYIVPLRELNELLLCTDIDYMSSFRHVALLVFTTFYIMVLGIIYRKDVSTKSYIYAMLYVVLFCYAILHTKLVSDLRSDIFHFWGEETYPVSYFFVHILSLPIVAYIVYLLVKNVKSYSGLGAWISWLLAALVVVILSVQTDNITVWMVGNADNYSMVLYDVHTFGYPILWGVIAMIMMIWGLNRKEALLRKISLVFFALIIVKFYAYDVWKMSQAGRIISFVLLGVILLLVSFLQQKIRTWVKDDENNEIEDNTPNEIMQ